MPKITLDSIREAVNAKYDATEIELSPDCIVKLRNPLRLPKEERKALVAKFDSFKGDGKKEVSDEDQVKLLSEVLTIAAEDKALVNILIETLGDDLALYAEVLETYVGGVQVGEASASQN